MDEKLIAALAVIVLSYPLVRWLFPQVYRVHISREAGGWSWWVERIK